GFAIFGSATVGGVFMLGIPFIALWGLANPTMQSLMSRRVDKNEQGRLQGALGSIRGIVGVFGPLLIAQVFRVTAGSKSVIKLPGMVYYLSAVLLTFTFILVWSITRSTAESGSAPDSA